MLAWPKPRGPARSKFQKRAEDEFKFAAIASKSPTTPEYEASAALTNGTLFVPRDFLIRAMFGLASEITLPDGTVITGVRRVVPDAQLVLDQVTKTAWAMVIRVPDSDSWQGLTPGSPGQVLGVKLDGSVDYLDQIGAVESVFGRTGIISAAGGDYDAVQVSFDPSHSGLPETEVQGALDALYDGQQAIVGALPEYVQTILDSLSSTRGAVLYRGALGWVALAPGTGGQVLVTQGSTSDPLWQTLSGGGGVPSFLPPHAADFATARNTPTLTDLTTSGLQVTGAAGGTAIRAKYKALAAVDKVYTARVWMNACNNNTAVGVAVRDSAGGKCITFGPAWIGQQVMQCTQWTTDTIAASNAWAAFPWQGGPVWLRLTWHKVAKTFDLAGSQDGVSWITFATANAFVANPDQIGPYMWSTTTAGVGGGNAIALFDYWTEV